jgi:hypothetical protein
VILLAIALSTAALPSPLNPLTAVPPLGARAPTEAEGVAHRVLTNELVRVRVDRTGRPFAVGVAQRLVVLGKGDYVFSIPAPVRDVVAGRGSESMPGQRLATIIWSGFNPGRKVLAANARLNVPEAAPALPLRIGANDGTITVTNVTPARAATFTAAAQAAPLARYLDSVRRALLRGQPVPVGTATIAGEARPASAAIEAPIRVTGTVGGRRVAATLGDGHPLALTVPRGDGTVALRAEPVPPLRLAAPPRGAASWRASGASGAALLARAQAVLLRIARVRQYDAYLADPDQLGRAQTAYVYRSGTPPRTAAPRPAPDAGTEDGGAPLAVSVAIAVGCVALLAAGLAAWARS